MAPFVKYTHTYYNKVGTKFEVSRFMSLNLNSVLNIELLGLSNFKMTLPRAV